jgi:hypothetical protein
MVRLVSLRAASFEEKKTTADGGSFEMMDAARSDAFNCQ